MEFIARRKESIVANIEDIMVEVFPFPIARNTSSLYVREKQKSVRQNAQSVCHKCAMKKIANRPMEIKKIAAFTAKELVRQIDI